MFIEDPVLRISGGDILGDWRGQLFDKHAHDRNTGTAARYTCKISQVGPDTFRLTTQGPHAGSRRHSDWPTLDAAQSAAIRWARRRFYIIPTA